MSFYLKYRPRVIADLDLSGVRDGLGRILATGGVNHAYLFVGPRGAGKTSTARILAKVVNCERNKTVESGKPLQEPCLECDSCRQIEAGNFVDVIEIDAASNRGIDAIRDLREKVGLLPVSAKRKVYIIDEVHMLTTEAFNALLKTLEEPPAHVMFILCTTEEYKVPETIASRCMRIRFTKATHDEMTTSLSKVAKGEKLDIKQDALDLLADSVDGSFREGHKLLEQLASFPGVISLSQVQDLLGQSAGCTPKILANLLVEGKTKEALDEIIRSDSLGVNWPSYTQTLLVYLRDQMRAQYGIGEANLQVSSKRIGQVIEGVTQSLVDMKTSVLPSLPLELLAVELGEVTQAPEPVVKKTPQVSHPQPPVASKPAQSTPTPQAVEPDQLPVQVTPEPIITPIEDVPSDIKVDLGTVVKRWEDILTALAPKNHSVAGLLRSAHPKAVEGRYLVLEVFYKFHKEQLEQDAKRRLLEEALAETVGPLIVRCVLGQKTVEAMQKMPEVDNVVVVNPDKELASAVEDVFGVGIS